MDITTWPLFDIALISSLVCILAYLYLDWTFSHWKKKMVPSVPVSSYIYGNIKELINGKKGAGFYIQEIYDRYSDKPFVGLYELHRPALLLRDPELIKKVLVENFNSFHDNRANIQEKNDLILGSNPFFIRGERWKEARTTLTHCLTSSKLRQMPESIRAVYQNLKKYLEDKNQDIEADKVTKLLTSDTAALWSWGIQGGGFSGDKSFVREVAEKISDEIDVSSWDMHLMTFNPWFSNWIKIAFLSKEQIDFFIDVTKQSLKQIIDTKNTSSPCVLNSLFEDWKKGSLEEISSVPDSILKRFSQTLGSFYIDSYETTGRALSFALYTLAVFPDIQKRLRKEAIALTEEQLISEHVYKLEYLDMFVTEVLRMYPPANHLRKFCTKKSVLGGIPIDTETNIVIPIQALHYDPQYYPEPDKFNPERFSEENKKSLTPYTYLPFGSGPRMCPGIKFALNQMKIVICNVVRDFEVLPAESHETRPIKPSKVGFLFVSDHPLFVRFRRKIGEN